MSFYSNLFLCPHASITDPVNVSMDCANGQDIITSYEIIYANSFGTSMTCDVNRTDCSDGECQINIPNSRCQPQFNGGNVTLTTTNIVGRSNFYVSRNISELLIICDGHKVICMKSYLLGSLLESYSLTHT